MSQSKQQTIQGSVTLQGQGLHTGQPCNLTFHPAAANHGIVFQRVDLDGQPTIPALVEHVVDTSRGTTLGIGDVQVHTVEHVLSALMGAGVDNVLVSLDGPEPPIMDGSARAFVAVLLQAGLAVQEDDRDYFDIEEPLHYLESDRQVELAILPNKSFQATVMVDFDSPVLKPQQASLYNLNQYQAEIADSRTFCFLHELQAMHEAGLIQGGNLESAVVIMDRNIEEDELDRLKAIFGTEPIDLDSGILNSSGLRHDNEPARHKLLDLIGDLALVGKPLRGHVIASRPGHKANVELAKKIRAKVKQRDMSRRFMKNGEKGLVFDTLAIQEILPHRYPFLLVDKIVSFTDNTITGIKNVTINEPFFQGHFPGNPIMPGVLQLEAMAQVGGILLLNNIENPKTIWVYFVAIDNARFKKPVKPGDTLVLELEMTAMKRSICKMTGKAFVDGSLVCSADLVASVVPK